MAFAVLLPGVASAEGEQVLGTLSTSRSGPIPDVQITVTDADGKEIGQVQTDDRGRWAVDLPGEGQYEVTLDAGDLPDDVQLGSGGDSRCNCPPWPTDGTAPAIPCDGRTSTVAYILAADPKDSNGDSHNNGKYSMYLTTSQPGPDKGEPEKYYPTRERRQTAGEERRLHQDAVYRNAEEARGLRGAQIALRHGRGPHRASAARASGRRPGGPRSSATGKRRARG